MSSPALIRNYTISDQPAILDLFDLNCPTSFAPEEKQDLIRYLGTEIEYYYVLEQEDTIVGCGGFNFSGNESHAKISWDIFHPGHQGKGLGSLLLKHRLKKLRAFKQVKTITVRTSQLAYLFYQKQGFQLKETIKDYWAEGFDLYRMEYPHCGDDQLFSE
jgi:ribosomal-protein-alanine N-acetyltransferase